MNSFLDWLKDLPEPALVTMVGLVALLECTIGLGLFFPGEGALIIASTTANSPSRFITLVVVVTICASAGDSIGYYLGRRFGPGLRDTKLIRGYGVKNWDRTADMIRRRGAWAVLVGRFLPLVRALPPAASGAAGVPFRKFILASVTGALGWSILHISLGAALGEAMDKVFGNGWKLLMYMSPVIVVGLIVRRKRKKRRAAAEAAEEAAAASGTAAAADEQPVV